MNSEDIVGVKHDAALWEAVAAIQVMQACGTRRVQFNRHNLLFHLAGMALTPEAPTVSLNLDAAYRTLGKAPNDMSYHRWLGKSSGIDLPQEPPTPLFPRVYGKEEIKPQPYVVLCPFSLDDMMPTLPLAAWRSIVRFLRSHDVEVYLLGESGQRMDGLNFSEGAICSEMALPEKLLLLASADLVVGMPNAWLWIATAWKRRIAVFYPDDVPQQRWLGFYRTPLHGRVNYTAHQVQIPLLLAGLRQLFHVMREHDPKIVHRFLQ